MNINVRKHLLALQKISYVNEDEDTAITGGMIDCSLGTNPLGCSTLIMDSKELFQIEKIIGYPEFPYLDLKKEIAKYWKEISDINCSNIRIGNGSMGIIDVINKMFIDKDSKVLGYCPQFTDYAANVEAYGGIYEYGMLKAENNFKFNADVLLNEMSEEHKIIYIDNPNNPTGQIINLLDLIKVIEEAEKKNIYVIVDEAYGDFMCKEKSAISLFNRYNNLIILRTFSKGFGLAGVRVGYMISHDSFIEYYKKIDMPFTVNYFGSAIAQLALKDEEFIKNSTEIINELKYKLIRSCSKIKVLETSLEIPIMVLVHPDENVDLYKLFLSKKVLTESGVNFVGLKKNSVRLRIPRNLDKLIEVVTSIEQEI